MTQLRQPISAAEAAAILSEDARTVQRKAKSGEYKSSKLPGLRGAYIFDRGYVEQVAAIRRQALLSPTSDPERVAS